MDSQCNMKKTGGMKGVFSVCVNDLQTVFLLTALKCENKS